MDDASSWLGCCLRGGRRLGATIPSVMPMSAKTLAVGASSRVAQPSAAEASPDRAWCAAIKRYAWRPSEASGIDAAVASAPAASPLRA